MKNIFKLTKYLKPYWKQAVLALLLLIAVVFMDLSIPRLVQRIIDDGIYQNDMQLIIRTGLIMLGISVTSTLFSIGNNSLSVGVGEAFARDLREGIFLKIQELSYGNLDNLKTGNLIVRLTSDIDILQQTFRMSMRIGSRAPLLMIGSIILMVTTDVRLTLWVIPLLLVTLLVIALVVMKLSPLFRQVQKKLDNLNTVLQENIAGVRVVKAFVRQEYEKDRFEVVNSGFTNVHIKLMRSIAIVFPFLMLLVNAGVLIVVWLGGVQAIQGNLSVGEIIAFSNYLMTTMTPLLIMAMLANVFASGIVSAERINDVLAAQPEIKEKEQAKALPGKIKGKVVFENVCFNYNGRCEEKVLDGITFTAESGQNVAILGATGSGKSTLVNLIPRFYDVSSGKITIDGIDIRDVHQDSLLSKIGVTPQETILFSGTIKENIAYGKPNATDAEVVCAAKAVQAHPFISELPDGYETHIAARGVNLSGGQKQRIAIARAILMKPPILIFDDSTSSVDVETETKIQDAIEEISAESTTFIVAQRISTVLRADKIIVLELGKIAAEGDHRTLIQTSPIYREIYESQLGNGNPVLQGA